MFFEHVTMVTTLMAAISMVPAESWRLVTKTWHDCPYPITSVVTGKGLVMRDYFPLRTLFALQLVMMFKRRR